MLRSPFSREPSNLDHAIEAVYVRMSELELNDPDYDICLKHLQKLEGMKNEIRLKPPSSDTVLVALAHVVGILVIVAYEQKHVMTSKAINFIMKLKA